MITNDEIPIRFRANLERVRSLVSLYEGTAPGGRGRKPVPSGDLLRAAVVLLHTTLEDFLRSLAEWKLPTAPAGSFERMMFAGLGKPRDKITLVDLAEFRGQSVDEVISRSIEAHLEGSSYMVHPARTNTVALSRKCLRCWPFGTLSSVTPLAGCTI